MSRKFAIKILTPLAVSASALGAVLMMSGAPQPARADLPPVGAVVQAVPPLQQGLPSLAPMLKTVMPAVVNIAVTSKAEIQNPLLQDPFFRRFFGAPEGQQQPQEREAQAIGSGVVVDAVKGYVLTNSHVVAEADSIRVRMSDDREYDAKLIGKDPDTDVAVLQIKADNLVALKMADSDQLQVGDFVVAIGSPFGLRQTVTSGIVSGLSRQTGISEGGYEDFIQTDASINPGNSGGALVNLRGELVGIPSNILSRSGGNIGIGFAIPTNLARDVMTQLVSNGEIQRGRLGINGQDLTPDLAKAFSLSTTRGAVITRVLPKSPADKAGLKSEDVILEANGRPIENFAQLRNRVGLMRIGDKVTLKILREGKPREVAVTIGKEEEIAADTANLHPQLKGATFAPLDDAARKNAGDTRGVLVQAVEPRSAAARAGLRQGDIVIAVNRRAVQDLEDFSKLANPQAPELLLHVRRGPGALFILIR
nr:DegQ family serine endoprotease [Solimonas sp. K1W22B-7]